jgi:phosphatidylserine/phosphatidylglycerophosphate/cardiolipin synthase-like enzyme
MTHLSVLSRLALTSILFWAVNGYATPTAPPPSQTPSSVIGTLQFLESFPEETDLDLVEFSEAHLIWPTVLGQAKKSIDVASFYFSRIGDGEDAMAPPGITDRLVPSAEALVAAGLRGLQVQVLGDSKFQKTYPEALAWFNDHDGTESRVVDIGSQWGGVMHAKYFVVDEQTLYIGSQNWDWRAMTQIRELGALVTHPGLARDLKRIFELDWAIAGGQTTTPAADTPAITLNELPHARLETKEGEPVTAVLAASPPAGLPEGVAWDLPLLTELIDTAENTVHLQLLSYNVSDREGRYFADLDNALRRAAARNVQVQILLANWSKVHYKLHWIQSLAAVKNIEVKFSNIPEHSKGFIPFGRVEHPKYLTVDGKGSWIGTSNWSRDYFYSSRNVSLFLLGEGAAQPLDRFFAKGWDSPYAETVDPSGQYDPPKRN